MSLTALALWLCCVQGKAKLQTLWGHSLYHRDDLPFAEGLRDMPNGFTSFREKVEKQCRVRGRPPKRC
jgi:deoxyribodipyrimidine photo-lyase